MVTRNLGFESLTSIAVSNGATSPNPGSAGVWAWSTTLKRPMMWDGSRWYSASTGAPDICKQVVDGYLRNFYNNPRNRPVMANPPTVTVGTATRPSGLTVEFPYGTYPVYNTGGGVPSTASGVTSFPIVGGAAMSWRVETILDGDEITFLLSSVTSAGYRFLVDGQYVSKVGTSSASGSDRWYTLTFPTRARRRITVEGQTGMTFARAAVKPTDTLIRPERAASICFVGDSDFTSFGNDYKGDGYVENMGDFLGVFDVKSHGISNSGFVAGGSDNFQNSSRTSVYYNTGAQSIVFEISINDYTLVTNATITVNQLRDAIVSVVSNTRAAVGPNIPIIVFPDTINTDWQNGGGSGLPTIEAVFANAVDALGDPFVRFIRMSNSTTDIPAINTVANWNYYRKGDNHLSVDGCTWVGMWTAQQLALAYADMAGIPMTSPVPKMIGQDVAFGTTAPAAPYYGQLWLDTTP